MSKLTKKINLSGRTDGPTLIIKNFAIKNYLLLVTTIKMTVAFPNTETRDIRP